MQVPPPARSALQTEDTGLALAHRFNRQVRLPASPLQTSSRAQSVVAVQGFSQKVLDDVHWIPIGRAGSVPQTRSQAQSRLPWQGANSFSGSPGAQPASPTARHVPSSMPPAKCVSRAHTWPAPHVPASARGSQSDRQPKPPSPRGKQSVPAPQSSGDPRGARGSQLSLAVPSMRHTGIGEVTIAELGATACTLSGSGCNTNGEK